MKQIQRFAVIAGVLGVVLGLLYVRVLRGGPVEVDSGYRVVMGTFSRVVVIADGERTANACVEAAFDVQGRIESLMSYHREDSELSKVNRHAGEGAVPVNPMTFEVLRRAVHFSRLSEGAFDVTVGPLVDLWRTAGEASELPTDEALAEARRKVGYEKLILDDKAMTVRFAEPGMRIDLGGIGKGYAVDKAVEAMKKRGALGGMVDLGGNIRCFGRPLPGRSKWRVALQDPNVAPNEVGTPKYLLVLELEDVSVATSGHYRRFTKIQGQQHSHIMDTHSGHSAGKLASTTIIAPDATSADALSTAVSVLGPEAGMALIDRLASVEAILLPMGDKASLLYSQGARAYIASKSGGR